MAAAFSAQGFRTTLDRAPTFSMMETSAAVCGFGHVDIGVAGEPGDCDGCDIGNREVGVERLLEEDRVHRADLHGEAQRQGPREGF